MTYDEPTEEDREIQTELFNLFQEDFFDQRAQWRDDVREGKPSVQYDWLTFDDIKELAEETGLILDDAMLRTQLDWMTHYRRLLDYAPAKDVKDDNGEVRHLAEGWKLKGIGKRK